MSEIKPEIEIDYRVVPYEEMRAHDSDETYSLLVGPDDFWCCLMEPEDRSWYRDGRAAVKRLNEQHQEILRLRKLTDPAPCSPKASGSVEP